MLEKGTKAPEFSLPDENGEIRNLSDYRGKKLILYFYPKDNNSVARPTMPNKPMRRPAPRPFHKNEK